MPYTSFSSKVWSSTRASVEGLLSTHLLPSMMNCLSWWDSTPSTRWQPYASTTFCSVAGMSADDLPAVQGGASISLCIIMCSREWPGNCCISRTWYAPLALGLSRCQASATICLHNRVLSWLEQPVAYSGACFLYAMQVTRQHPNQACCRDNVQDKLPASTWSEKPDCCLQRCLSCCDDVSRPPCHAGGVI